MSKNRKPIDKLTPRSAHRLGYGKGKAVGYATGARETAREIGEVTSRASQYGARVVADEATKAVGKGLGSIFGRLKGAYDALRGVQKSVDYNGVVLDQNQELLREVAEDLGDVDRYVVPQGGGPGQEHFDATGQTLYDLGLGTQKDVARVVKGLRDLYGTTKVPVYKAKDGKPVDKDGNEIKPEDLEKKGIVVGEKEIPGLIPDLAQGVRRLGSLEQRLREQAENGASLKFEVAGSNLGSHTKVTGNDGNGNTLKYTIFSGPGGEYDPSSEGTPLAGGLTIIQTDTGPMVYDPKTKGAYSIGRGNLGMPGQPRGEGGAVPGNASGNPVMVEETDDKGRTRCVWYKPGTWFNSWGRGSNGRNSRTTLESLTGNTGADSVIKDHLNDHRDEIKETRKQYGRDRSWIRWALLVLGLSLASNAWQLHIGEKRMVSNGLPVIKEMPKYIKAIDAVKTGLGYTADTSGAPNSGSGIPRPYEGRDRDVDIDIDLSNTVGSGGTVHLDD
ncbi:MAG: hypothetical protein JSW08_01090 [archaeon]|nr:MAG: hypothetical protein JSW08_01090 [archaeon]